MLAVESLRHGIGPAANSVAALVPEAKRGAVLATGWLAERSRLIPGNPFEPVANLLVDHPLALAAGLAVLAVASSASRRSVPTSEPVAEVGRPARTKGGSQLGRWLDTSEECLLGEESGHGVPGDVGAVGVLEVAQLRLAATIAH